MDVGDVQGTMVTWDTPTAVTVAADLFDFELSFAAAGFRVGGLSLMQTTDLGDANHEIILFQYLYGNTTNGSGGGTPDMQGVGQNFDGFFAATKACRNTTQASGGSLTKGAVQGWNVLQPTDFWYPNGMEPVLIGPAGVGATNVVRMLAAPADSLTMHATIWIRAGQTYWDFS